MPVVAPPRFRQLPERLAHASLGVARGSATGKGVAMVRHDAVQTGYHVDAAALIFG